MNSEDNTAIILRELGKLQTRLDSIETKVDTISIVHDRIKKEASFNRVYGHVLQSDSDEETSEEEDEEEEHAILERKKKTCQCCIVQ